MNNNRHADVTALIDQQGFVKGTYYYDAFGNILETSGSVNNSITYAGYQYDKETGLYYLNARMYDPKTARFLQEDTYRGDPNDPLSLNLYTYCHNEPIMYNDPTGHLRKAVFSFNGKDALAFMQKDGYMTASAQRLAIIFGGTMKENKDGTVTLKFYNEKKKESLAYTYKKVMKNGKVVAMIDPWGKKTESVNGVMQIRIKHVAYLKGVDGEAIILTQVLLVT